MKLNKGDTSFVEACHNPEKRAALLADLFMQRRISSISLSILLLVFFVDFIIHRIHSDPYPSQNLGLFFALLTTMIVTVSVDIKIKLLLSQK